MMLMYWRPRHYYVEHLLLFVHNHAFFVFLVASLVLLLGKFVPHVPGLDLAIVLYIAWYMYRSMRVVYQQGRRLTIVQARAAEFFLSAELRADARLLAASPGCDV